MAYSACHAHKGQVKELKAALSQLGLKTSGKKAELCQRLIAALQSGSAATDATPEVKKSPADEKPQPAALASTPAIPKATKRKRSDGDDEDAGVKRGAISTDREDKPVAVKAEVKKEADAPASMPTTATEDVKPHVKPDPDVKPEVHAAGRLPYPCCHSRSCRR